MERREALQKVVLAAGAAVLAQAAPAMAACATVLFDGQSSTRRFFKISSVANVCSVSVVSVSATGVFSNNLSIGCRPEYRIGLPKNGATYWVLVVTNGGADACCFKIVGTVVTDVP